MFLFYPLTLNIICFVKKIFLRFYLCIFESESDTVKSDCPVQENYLKIKYILLVYFTSFTVCSRDIKNNALKMTSHQSTGHFQSFFSPPPRHSI